MTEQSKNSALEGRILVVDEARYLMQGDKALTLNVAKDFRDDEVREFLMELLEQMADHRLSSEQRGLAVAIGLRLPEGETISLGTLVQAWLPEPTLREFAAALLYAAFPGAQAELRCIEGLTINRNGANAIIRLDGSAPSPQSGTS